MDHAEAREIVEWVRGVVGDGSEPIVAGFSGSYPSAAGLALLRKCFPDNRALHPVYVCAKDDVWRMDLVEAWIPRLGYPPKMLSKVILNEVLDDLEDQHRLLEGVRSEVVSRYKLLALELWARALSKYTPFLWFGDRGSALYSGTPQLSCTTIAPFSKLSYQEVRQLGSFLSVDESWITSWGGAPKGWVVSENTRRSSRDRLVGWVQAHSEDLRELPEGIELSDGVVGGHGFSWMGWVPEDTYERVALSEIAESLQRNSEPLTKEFGGGRDRLQLLNSGYRMSFQGTPPKSFPVLGSIRVQAITGMGENSLSVNGIAEDGRRVTFSVLVTSEAMCVKLIQKLEGQERASFPVRLTREGEELWYLFSLSETGLKSLQDALEDVLSYVSILPEEIVDRPLTQEELREKQERSAKLRDAPRPPSRR